MTSEARNKLKVTRIKGAVLCEAKEFAQRKYTFKLRNQNII